MFRNSFLLFLLSFCFLASCQNDDEMDDESANSTGGIYYLSSCVRDTIFKDSDRWNSGEESVFKRVEQMPRWFDCKDIGSSHDADLCTVDAIQGFLDDNVTTPEEAITAGVSGIVAVQFIVDKEGCLHDINIVQDIGYGCGAAVQGAISLMPKWDPGRQRGREVFVRYTLPYSF